MDEDRPRAANQRQRTHNRGRSYFSISVLFLAGCFYGPPAQSQSSDFDSVAASAATARSQGDLAQAVQLYSKGVQLNPQWQEGWWSLGTISYGADQYEQAIEALNHLIALTPEAPAALALRGLCEFETGQYPESLQDLEHGIALGAANQPRNAQILLYHEALLLTRVGRFEDAIAKYTDFVKHAPANPELAVAVGLAGLRLPLLPKEVEDGQREMAASVGAAAMTVMSGDLENGQKAFATVFNQYPAVPNIHYFDGYLLFAAHSDEAAPEFERETAISPHNALAHAMLAWVLEFESNAAAALPEAAKAAADDPSLPFAQLVYGRALVDTGDPEAGLAHLQTVLQAEPQNLEAHITLAKVYSKLGRHDEARRERLLCLQMVDQSSRPAGEGSSATP